MSHFTPLIACHAAAAFTSVCLGPVQILRPRRDTAHRILGFTWIAAIVTTCITSFWVMPQGFTWLHGLAIFTLCTVTLALVSIVRGNVKAHLRGMIGSYLGLLAAFAFAVGVPSRLIQTTLHQSPTTILLITAALVVGLGLWATGAIGLFHGRRRTELPISEALRPGHLEPAAEG